MNLNVFCINFLRASVAALLLALNACSLMHDDLPQCPDGVDVQLVYDYNLEHSDLFASEVGGATVYVFDDQNRFVTLKEESGPALASTGYRMHLKLQPGKYKLVAIAADCSYDEMLAAGGAVFRRAELIPGDPIEKLKVSLDRADDGSVTLASKPMPVHFMSIEPVAIEIRDMETAEARIELMRHTNTLHLNVYRKAVPQQVDFNDFDIRLSAPDALINYDNSLQQPQPQAIFTPYLCDYDFPSDGVKRGKALIDFSRILSGSGNSLLFVDRLTGQSLSWDNLDATLAVAREAYPDKNYSPQEFLDRAHDFELDVYIDGDIKYVDVRVSILNWSKRIQDVSF